MYIDTHAHLNFKDFSSDYPQAISRAFEADVLRIINVGSNYLTSKRAVEIAKGGEGLYAAVGLHPVHVKEEPFDEEKFIKLVKDKKVVAIGEIGLDYYHDKENAFDQQAVFGRFLKIANITGKPVIMHSRDAGEDLMSVLMSQGQLPKGVMHCFSENWDFARVILDMGFYISFTGVITFTKNQQTLKVIEEAPLDRILIETDCPYMTPEPYRGKRNEPAYVVEVARKISEIKKIPLTKVAEQTSKNAQELFKIS